jgi:hypothetical protein
VQKSWNGVAFLAKGVAPKKSGARFLAIRKTSVPSLLYGATFIAGARSEDDDESNGQFREPSEG